MQLTGLDPSHRHRRTLRLAWLGTRGRWVPRPVWQLSLEKNSCPVLPELWTWCGSCCRLVVTTVNAPSSRRRLCEAIDRFLETFWSLLAFFQTHLPGRLPSHLTFFLLQFWQAMATFSLFPVLREAAGFERDTGMSDDVVFTYLFENSADLLRKRRGPRRNEVLISQSLASAAHASRPVSEAWRRSRNSLV